MDVLFKISRLDWWMYLTLALSFFITVVLLNYVLKKINEARLKERVARIRNKALTTRSVQVQRQPLPLETTIPSKMLESVFEHSNPKGISLVFNKDDNLTEDRRSKDQIKDFPNPAKITKSDASENNTTNEAKTNNVPARNEEIIQPAFFGSIYKDLSSVKVGKTRNLNTDLGNSNIVNETNSKVNVKNTRDIQDKEKQKRTFDSSLVEQDESSSKMTATSECDR